MLPQKSRRKKLKKLSQADANLLFLCVQGMGVFSKMELHAYVIIREKSIEECSQVSKKSTGIIQHQMSLKVYFKRSALKSLKLTLRNVGSVLCVYFVEFNI